ncbi:methyltransferase family protein [Methylobacterium gnaphalii]|uniref:Isoprenylcysteine carboxyl methyltransferase n=1 Tax=Methylobacterium gnaphalii TaxID=1010610 RepID=A0A512JJK9_9HYPH|nr:isoprenylcysteine carboxylmethyltransferase family protein [Methylobacterium gnaphalii]GEP10147.1 isoprenylcysteine carboxyl methyltransferase [Methylobacterium gnaphalii]GJD69502.1 hypothetical protein MMMDOFMJ_2433 [Methylobacterium gnaphalii]GLS48417.1 isoprenylcysteine carboxyl methyltransferase [Methylobacterium gnaphalii]
MIVNLIVQIVLWFGGIGVILFGLAGTLRWMGAWVFLAELTSCGLVSGLLLAKHDPALLKERLRLAPAEGQPVQDKQLMVMLFATMLAWLIVMPLDAVRFGWSWVPVWLKVVGAIGLPLSMWITYRTFRANSFAVPTVRIQRERGHALITSGPYAYVRHPMYAGALIMFASTSLLLGSWWALALLPVFLALFGVRTGLEERTLRTGLDGYDTYTARVRYRLIPGIW